MFIPCLHAEVIPEGAPSSAASILGSRKRRLSGEGDLPLSLKKSRTLLPAKQSSKESKEVVRDEDFMQELYLSLVGTCTCPM